MLVGLFIIEGHEGPSEVKPAISDKYFHEDTDWLIGPIGAEIRLLYKEVICVTQL